TGLSPLGLSLRKCVQRRPRLRSLPAREGRPAVRHRVDRDRSRRRLPPARGIRGMKHLPIRVPLPLVLALALGVVLYLAGSLVYVRVAGNLNNALDEPLRSRAQDV